MPKKQLFLGIRRDNGQIGYLSESLSIPEFFELIRPRTECKPCLVDFSPVIEALHSKHSQFVEQSIREKYNGVFNYWQESKSYSNLQIKLPKFESLSLLSNELIASLQFRINTSKGNYSYRGSVRAKENINVIKSIESDCNIYIDVLLCFIHSKASLEIESFKKDVVLNRYCEFLREIVSDLFNSVVDYSTWQDRFELNESSLLYYIAFANNDELKYYTQLLPSFNQSIDLRLNLLTRSHSEQSYNHRNELVSKIAIEIRIPNCEELESAKILRNLLYKINSISELISKLKAGGVDWNPDENSVEELKQLVIESPCNK